MAEAFSGSRQRRLGATLRASAAPSPWPVVAVLAAGGVLAASFVIVLTGGSPALLILASTGLVTAALSARLPVLAALAATLLGAFAVLPVAMRLVGLVDLPITGLLALPAVAGLAAIAFLWRSRAAVTVVSRADLALGVGLVGFSLLQVLVVWLARTMSGTPKLAWMMNNDSPWNLVSARFIVEDGGLDPGAHRNPAPLANELVGLFLAPGRSGVGPADLLAHDLLRTSQALLLLVAATSVLAGVLVASGVPSDRPWSRAVLAGMAALIPWTWSFAGQVFVYGFWNSLPTAVLLLAVWAAWTEAERSPVVASALLATSGVGLLAAWAPLVVAPVGLGLLVVVWHARAHLALRGLRLVAWLAPPVLLVAYAATVTLGDFAAAADGLSVEGLFPAFGEHLPLAIWLLALAVLLVCSVWAPGHWDLVGVLALGVLGAVGTRYLMGQREGSPAGPWGYYPQKFAWSLAALAPFIVLRSVRGLLVSPGLDRARRRSLVLGAVLLAGVLLLQVPPFDPRPLAAASYPIAHRTPDYRLTSLLPTLSISYSDRASAMDPAVESVLAFSDQRRKVVVSRWTGDPGADGFINYWLLQLPVDQVDDEPRDYAYGLDSNNPAGLCDLVRDWGGGVTIRTLSETLDDEMATACPDGDYAVVVGS